jgi:hypothetical protein
MEYLSISEMNLTIDGSLKSYSDGLTIYYDIDIGGVVFLEKDGVGGIEFDETHRNVVFSEEAINIVVSAGIFTEVLSIPEFGTVGKIIDTIQEFYDREITDQQYSLMKDSWEYLNLKTIYKWRDFKNQTTLMRQLRTNYVVFVGLKHVENSKVYTVGWKKYAYYGL